ncbi:hypothetical protein L9F63_015106, partial [Diploptera punctata]
TYIIVPRLCCFPKEFILIQTENGSVDKESHDLVKLLCILQNIISPYFSETIHITFGIFSQICSVPNCVNYINIQRAFISSSFDNPYNEISRVLRTSSTGFRNDRTSKRVYMFLNKVVDSTSATFFARNDCKIKIYDELHSENTAVLVVVTILDCKMRNNNFRMLKRNVARGGLEQYLRKFRLI